MTVTEGYFVRRLMGKQHSVSNLQVNMMGIFKSGQKSKSKLRQNNLKTKEDQGLLTAVDCPPQSTDLNSTEHLLGT